MTAEQMTAEFRQLREAAESLAADVSAEIDALIREGMERPLTTPEATQLLQKIVAVVRARAKAHGDDAAISKLTEDFIRRVVATRDIVAAGALNGRAPRTPLQLVDHNGIAVAPVKPAPTFHGREVPMNGGFVKVDDIHLWERNERLDVHVAQFAHERGRPPRSDELLQIMLSEMPLKGIDETDQFRILDLARSIANNGVRRPPIIDLSGELLDGNRRVAACQYILRTSEFTADQKKRVEWLYVWQLTSHATDQDRDYVVVSLNFEPDYKQDWPTYVKARRIYDEYQRLLSLEPRTPDPRRINELKRTVSLAFALGPKLDVVNRYIKMVEVANEFEDYHVGQRKRDDFEVKHAATRRFEYFDELSKGANPGGVAHTLGQDDALRQLVFDLLFQGKFRNFAQIRDIKHVPDNPDMLEQLEAARTESDIETARSKVDDALDIVRSRKAEKRRLGANARIETFVQWLEDLPLGAIRDSVSEPNVEGLLRALKLVRLQAIERLGESRVTEILK